MRACEGVGALLTPVLEEQKMDRANLSSLQLELGLFMLFRIGRSCRSLNVHGSSTHCYAMKGTHILVGESTKGNYKGSLELGGEDEMLTPHNVRRRVLVGWLLNGSGYRTQGSFILYM